MSQNTENKILTGVIWKQLLIFFFPILIGTFFQQLYNTVDAVIVGRFVGKEALSSVGGSAGQIINLVVGFFTGLTAGGTVLISQYYRGRNFIRDCRSSGNPVRSSDDEYAGGADGTVHNVYAGLFWRAGVCIFV